jgi:hypothetical protein
MSDLGGWFDGPAVVYTDPGTPGSVDPTTHLVYSDAGGVGFNLSRSMALHPLGWLLGTFAAGWAGGYLAWVQLGKRGYSGGYGGLGGPRNDEARREMLRADASLKRAHMKVFDSSGQRRSSSKDDERRFIRAGQAQQDAFVRWMNTPVEE